MTLTTTEDRGKVPVTASVVLIGDELLSGQTRDINLPWIAQFLNDIGVQTVAAEIIPDRHEAIIGVLGRLREQTDYVITTGGIGPTHDDITAEAVARLFGVSLSINAEARQRLEDHYGTTRLTSARLRMARIPEGARLIDNPVSIAPGFEIGNIFVLAGVPNIMQAMLTGAAGRFRGGRRLLVTGVYAYGGEGIFSASLERLQGRYADATIGSYPIYRHDGTFATRLIARCYDVEQLKRVEADLLALVGDAGIEVELLSAEAIMKPES